MGSDSRWQVKRARCPKCGSAQVWFFGIEAHIEALKVERPTRARKNCPKRWDISLPEGLRANLTGWDEKKARIGCLKCDYETPPSKVTEWARKGERRGKR